MTTPSSAAGSENPGWTYLVIQNNTDYEATLADHNDKHWEGNTPPKIDANRSTTNFYHNADRVKKASVGGVAYQVGSKAKLIIAWQNEYIVNNKVYTKFVNPCDDIIWADVYKELKNNTTNDKNFGFSSSVVIDLTSGQPTLTAVLGPSAK